MSIMQRYGITLIGGPAIGLISGYYIWNDPLRLAKQTLQEEKGLVPEPVPDLLSGSTEIPEMKQRGPKAKADMTYYSKDYQPPTTTGKKQFQIYQAGEGPNASTTTSTLTPAPATGSTAPAATTTAAVVEVPPLEGGAPKKSWWRL